MTAAENIEGTGAERVDAVRLPEKLRRAGAARLVATDQSDPRAATERFIASAGDHGIDLGLMWGVVDRSTRVREVVLVVPGAGATAMMFCSKPDRRAGRDDGHAARVAAIRGACAGIADAAPSRVRVMQCLPEPHEVWAHRACDAAGMTTIGRLDYLRRPFKRADAENDPGAPPDDVTVRSADEIRPEALDSTLITALERSYVETLDCPELSGMRTTDDILASHRGTGVYDPALWSIAYVNGEPEGCLLLTRCPEFSTVELVYIGLSPKLRGRRFGQWFMSHGLAQAAMHAPRHDVTCAVDARNLPAQRLYERLGFTRFAERCPFVQAV